MKKTLKPLLLVPVLLLATACNFKYVYNIKGVTGGDTGGDIWEDDSGIDDSGTYNIKIWVDQSIEQLTSSQVASFVSTYGGKYTINLNIEPMTESNAATSMIQDVQDGADIFCFAQDQLARLKVAGAITKLTGSLGNYIRNKNSEDSIKAGSIGSGLYAFPTTSDNGYFLYYNKQYVNDAAAKNMTTLLASLKAAGKKLNFSARADGFYAASYFIGMGCHSNWTINEESGKFTKFDDNYNTEEGFIAAKGIKEIADDSIVATRSIWTSEAGAIVSGIWEYAGLAEKWGANLGCAELPTFTVDGVDHHLGSLDGYKFIGVKPQVDSKKASVCRKLAQFLTNNACQTERFNLFGWGPTHLETSARPDVIAHPGLSALKAQHAYAAQQGQCPGAWFSTLMAAATAIKSSSTDADIRSILAAYEAGLPACLSDD